MSCFYHKMHAFSLICWTTDTFSGVLVCPPTFALKSHITIVQWICFSGYYQCRCGSCLSLRLSEMQLLYMLLHTWMIFNWCMHIMHETSYAALELPEITLVECLSLSCLRLLVHRLPRSGTASRHFTRWRNVPLFFGPLRTLSRPISCYFLLLVFLSVIQMTRARVLVIALYVAIFSRSLLGGGSSLPRHS